MNNVLKVYVVSILIVLLVPVFCSSKDSGVLIGLRYSDNGEVNYRTIWITKKQGSIGLNAEGDDLLVPRKTGFWKVGILKQVFEECEEDFVWGAAVSEEPVIGEIDPEEVAGCEMVSTSTILFVGNDFISIEYASSGYCEGAAHPWDASWLSVYPIDSLGINLKCVPIMDVFGDKGFSEMENGATAFLSKLTDEEREALESEPDECRWGLIRRKGKWVVRGRLGYSYEVYRGNYGDFDISLSPPKSVVSHDKLCLSWAKIKEKVPKAIDGFSSPLEDMVVVLTKSKLFVFGYENDQLGDVALEMDFGKRESAVMIQWAVGKNVERWTQACEDHLTH